MNVANSKKHSLFFKKSLFVEVDDDEMMCYYIKVAPNSNKLLFEN